MSTFSLFEYTKESEEIRMTNRMKWLPVLLLLLTISLLLAGCADKKNITIKGGSGRIEENTYSNNTDIEKVVIENGITEIGEYAFDQCTNLASVTLPDSLEVIGDCAFRNCAFDSIDIPDGVTTIGYSAFERSQLKSVTVPASVTQSYGAFYWCSMLTEVTLQEGLETIGENCFSECDQLSAINIPDSVKSIGDGAFHNTALIAAAGSYLPPDHEALDTMIRDADDVRSVQGVINKEKGIQIIPLQYYEDFKGNLYPDLAGDLFCQMPKDIRTMDINEADYILLTVFSETPSSNHIGPVYDTTTSVYLCDKNKSAKLLFSINHGVNLSGPTVLAPGLSQISGDKATGEEIWTAVKEMIPADHTEP